jgi:hypothetical protein
MRNKLIKSIGALESFFGNFAGINFKIELQYNIYGNVDAIVVDKSNKNNIVLIDGNKKNIARQINQFYNYIVNNTNIPNLEKSLEKNITAFVKLVSDDIALRNKKNSTPIKNKIVKKAIKKNKTLITPVKKIAVKKNIVVKTKGKYDINRDAKRKALPPGKRISSETGKKYYEYRQNHSDKPGTMLGIGAIKTDIINKLNYAEECAAKYLANIAFEKRKAMTDKLKKSYWIGKANENKKKLAATLKLIKLLKKVAK